MDAAGMQKLNDTIEHYKRNIGRATEANNNDWLMKILSKLSRLPITVQNLQKTGIGRVVNGLRKYEGDIGESAKSLVLKWKNVVQIEESENIYQKEENSDEEEHQDVSSTVDDDELQISQSITSNVASTSHYNNNYNNEPELTDEKNNDSTDRESSHHRHPEKSKYKKSKKDRDGKKHKNSTCTSEDQTNGHISKKLKKDHKHESVKNQNDLEKHVIPINSHHKNHHSVEENIKKDKKSSHSDKRKDKHKSTYKSESKSHKDKHESKTGHKDKNDPKKKTANKIKEENKPSTSATCGGSSSSKTFEEALLGINVGKKKQVKSKYRDRSSGSSSSERETSPMSRTMKLAPINLDPEELISDYKPLPQLDVKKKKLVEDIDPLASIMTTKNIRTKVFSGNKTTIYSEVPTLIDCCVQIIKENLDALEYTGGVPFEILEPILKYANPDQLFNLEQFNDYLIEDTGELWKFHCTKEFRNKVPEKNESWRDFYLRCLEEREMKLAKLRQNINANQAASTPVRKTQLAYVDTAVKPPRGIARKQAKLLTVTDTRRNILNKSLMGGNSTAEALSAANSSRVPIASSHSQSSVPLKKKQAPLMKKTLQLMKSTRRH